MAFRDRKKRSVSGNVGPIAFEIGGTRYTLRPPPQGSQNPLSYIWSRIVALWGWFRHRADDRPAKRLEAVQRQVVEQYLLKIPPTSISEVGQMLDLIGETHRVQLQRVFPTRVYRLMLGWLAVVLAILALKAFAQPADFRLSDKVVITVLASTTATMVGLFVIVLRYLFPDGGHARHGESAATPAVQLPQGSGTTASPAAAGTDDEAGKA